MPEITVNGVELHYVDEGQGTPVVFVHGVWMSSRFFEKQRAFFGERIATSRSIFDPTGGLRRSTTGTRCRSTPVTCTRSSNGRASPVRSSSAGRWARSSSGI